MNSPPAPYYSPTPSAIITCWPIVESFVDFESTIATAQTCRGLHGTIVDADTEKIKVSHFEVHNYPPSPSSYTASRDAGAKSGIPEIPHYLSRSLNSIHFPSLRRLHLDFPLTKRRNKTGHDDIIEDVCNSSFPIFATNLAYAKNLESLYLDASRLMAIERSGHLESLYEILGANLSKCNKLRELSVRNVGIGRASNDWLYSVAFMRALIPTLKKRKLDLESLQIFIAGIPSDPLYERFLSTRGINAIFDFFLTALTLKKLETLDFIISSSHNHLNAIIEAAMRLSSSHEMEKPSYIQNLKLSYVELGVVDIVHSTALSSAAPLLNYFSECNQLRSLFLELPSECWNGCENIQALSNLLSNKPDMTSLTISFACCQDSNGKIVKVLSDFVCRQNRNNSNELCKFSVFGLLNADESDLDCLRVLLKESGMACSKYEMRDSSDVGRKNVMIIDYLRIKRVV